MVFGAVLLGLYRSCGLFGCGDSGKWAFWGIVGILDYGVRNKLILPSFSEECIRNNRKTKAYMFLGFDMRCKFDILI